MCVIFLLPFIVYLKKKCGLAYMLGLEISSVSYIQFKRLVTLSTDIVNKSTSVLLYPLAKYMLKLLYS